MKKSLSRLIHFVRSLGLHSVVCTYYSVVYTLLSSPLNKSFQ